MGKYKKRGQPMSEMEIRRELKMRWLTRVEQIADLLFDAHQQLALGHFVEELSPAGERIRIYRKSPDRGALEWMQEHIWGLAPQTFNLNAQVQDDRAYSTPEQDRALERALAYALPASKRGGYIAAHPALPEPARPADAPAGTYAAQPSGAAAPQPGAGGDAAVPPVQVPV